MRGYAGLWATTASPVSTQNAIMPIIISPWRALLALKVGEQCNELYLEQEVGAEGLGCGVG